MNAGAKRNAHPLLVTQGDGGLGFHKKSERGVNKTSAKGTRDEGPTCPREGCRVNRERAGAQTKTVLRKTKAVGGLPQRRFRAPT